MGRKSAQKAGGVRRACTQGFGGAGKVGSVGGHGGDMVPRLRERGVVGQRERVGRQRRVECLVSQRGSVRLQQRGRNLTLAARLCQCKQHPCGQLLRRIPTVERVRVGRGQEQEIFF
eukprot:scaffold13801_cov162-Isochrysis_galbana.AAC.6